MRSAAATKRASPSVWPVPQDCYLCGSHRLSLRFAARGDHTTPTGVEAYRCTSFGHRTHPPIWGCGECNLLFQWPMKSAADLVSAYSQVEDPLYVAEKENRYLTFRKAVKLLGPAGGRSLLDVGAYCGYFLDVAREAGFRPEGLELSSWASAQARQLGFNIFNETLEERSAKSRYDVITLWDVIEHFADPRAELEAVWRMLPSGGTTVVSTIDAGSLVARLFGASWPWLMDMHLFYFDRSTLPALLQSVGFEVTSVRNYTHTVSVDYLLRKLGASFAPVSPLTRLLQRITPSRLPVPVNLGDNMVVIARKP